MSAPATATAVPRWRPSPALAAGAITAVVLAAAGLVLARVDLALLALPLALATALSWERRPGADGTATAAITLTPAGPAKIDFALSIDAPGGVDAVVVRYRLLSGESREIVAAGRRPSGLSGAVPILHSGPQELVRIEYRLLGADGTVPSFASEPLAASRVLTPGRSALSALPLPHRLQGLTGSHESARPGDGGDFRDIHPFTAGDRLRRIDWKATARHGRNPGELYVRRTAALADATVLIVLDSRDDVGEQVAQWRSTTTATTGISSLDVAREAGSSIATGYIRAGDRVGFQDLSSRDRMLAHGGGSAHLRRLLRAIELAHPSEVLFRHMRAPIVPAGALVYLLSSLLDDQSARFALGWRNGGHRVIAVDVLPPARFARSTRYDRAAHRVVMMERDDRIRVLQARGVEVLHWMQDDPRQSRQARLRILSRPGRALAGAGRR